MGNRGRTLCVFTPMLLTAAAFVCLFLTGIGGFLNEKHGAAGNYEDNGPMTSLWFLRADFSNLNFDHAPESQANLTASLREAQKNLDKEYRIFLWDYCKTQDGSHFWCSGRYPEGYFDPVEVWDLNVSLPGSNSSSSGANPATINATDLNDEALGSAAVHALDAYRKAGHWLSVAYGFALWSALATLFCGCFGFFSRWGSFITWIISLVSLAPFTPDLEAFR